MQITVRSANVYVNESNHISSNYNYIDFHNGKFKQNEKIISLTVDTQYPNWLSNIAIFLNHYVLSNESIIFQWIDDYHYGYTFTPYIDNLINLSITEKHNHQTNEFHVYGICNVYYWITEHTTTFLKNTTYNKSTQQKHLKNCTQLLRFHLNRLREAIQFMMKNTPENPILLHLPKLDDLNNILARQYSLMGFKRNYHRSNRRKGVYRHFAEIEQLIHDIKHPYHDEKLSYINTDNHRYDYDENIFDDININFEEKDVNYHTVFRVFKKKNRLHRLGITNREDDVYYGYHSGANKNWKHYRKNQYKKSQVSYRQLNI